MFILKEYDKEYQIDLIKFLNKCLPESGRVFNIKSRHKVYEDIDNNFEYFVCLFNNKMIIGTVGLKRLNNEDCELKSLYIYKDYYGKGHGLKLLTGAINKAKSLGYKKMFLDTLSKSTNAISLYKKVGFTVTKRYNDNEFADIFMVLDLNN